MAAPPESDLRPPPLPTIDPRPARLRSLGFLPEHHPLLLHRLPPRRLRAGDLSSAMRNRTLTLHGLPITRKQVDATSAGTDGNPRTVPMSFVTLEDETGLIETVWFPEVYRAHGELLESGRALRIDGRLQESFGVLTVQVTAAGLVG
jgi:DNA polymerase III alpha subunit